MRVLPDWIPLSQVAGVIINEASPGQPMGPEPEGVSAVSPRPNNKGKLLVFVGIGVGLIAVCATVGFFYLEWGRRSLHQRKRWKVLHPSRHTLHHFQLKPITNLLSLQTRPPKVVSNNLKTISTAIEEGIRSELGKSTGELTKADSEKVRELYMPNDEITNLTPLAGLKGLNRLIIYDNPNLTKTQINKLQQALPKCKIIYNVTKF